MNAHQLPAPVSAEAAPSSRPKLCLVDSQYLQRLASQERRWDQPHAVKSVSVKNVAVKRAASARPVNRAGAKDRVRGGAAASNVARCAVASSRPAVSGHAETGKSSVAANVRVGANVAQLVGRIEKLNTALLVLAVFIGVIGCTVIGVSALSASQSICTADLVIASQNNLPYCP